MCNARNELIHASRGETMGLTVYEVSLDALKPPVESRDLNPTRNGATERSNRCRCSREIEQAANRKPYNGGIVQETNACGNA